VLLKQEKDFYFRLIFSEVVGYISGPSALASKALGRLLTCAGHRNIRWACPRALASLPGTDKLEDISQYLATQIQP